MRRLVLLLAAPLALSACDRSKAQLDQSIAQLQQVSAEKDSLLRDVVATSQFITEVNGELARAKGSGVDKPVVKGQGDLADTLSPQQLRRQVLDRVTALVTRLNESEKKLAASRAKVASLVKDNAAAKAQLAQFDSTVTALKVLVENQKQQVAQLTEQVAQLSEENAQLLKEKGVLTAEKEQLTVEKGQLTTEKNTVYYIVGTKDDLMKIHVIENQGGFIGIGRTVVPVRNLEPAAFTAIDRSKVKEIPFPAADKSYRIITRQDLSALEAPPADPNEIKGGLKIADPAKFWGASKFLIVVEN